MTTTKPGLLLCSICALTLASACASSTAPSDATAAAIAAAAAPAPAPAPAVPSSSTIHNAITTVLSGLTAAINGTKSGKDAGPVSTERFRFGPTLVNGKTPVTQCNANGSACTIDFNETFSPPATACADGGVSTTSATLVGRISGSSSSLSGTLNLNVQSVFAGCSAAGWITNTNPPFTTRGDMTFFANHTRLNLVMSGGMVLTNAPGFPNGRAACVTNSAILQWDDITGNWANSGSIDCTPGGSFKF